jgi:hypothetical protein
MSVYQPALTLTTPNGPLPVQTGIVAYFVLDLNPLGPIVAFIMDASFGAGRARATFPDGIPQDQNLSSGTIVPCVPGMKVQSWAPTNPFPNGRAWVGYSPAEWGSVELEPSVPPFPSRLDAISVKIPFQGFYVNSNAFSAKYQAQYGGNGQIPFFGAALADFWAAGDGPQVLDQICLPNAPFTHVCHFCSLGGAGYDEPKQPYGNDQIIPDFDCWSNMAVYLEIADAIIAKGAKPCYFLDGEGSPDWLQANFQSWVDQMRQGYDRLRYGPVIVAFDGVWPDSWSVDQMKQMIPWMRGILGNDAYLGFFFANGPGDSGPYLWVENEQDYTQPWMDGLDIVFTSTGTGAADCPSLANKAQYMVPSPNFSSCQPDQSSPFVFFDCSRGPRVWLLGEYATYQTVRDPNQAWKSICETARERCKALGCLGWG